MVSLYSRGSIIVKFHNYGSCGKVSKEGISFWGKTNLFSKPASSGAIIFGGRRMNDIPLVFQAFNWQHVVFLGATMGSEQTAAAVGSACLCLHRC